MTSIVRLVALVAVVVLAAEVRAQDAGVPPQADAGAPDAGLGSESDSEDGDRESESEPGSESGTESESGSESGSESESESGTESGTDPESDPEDDFAFGELDEAELEAELDALEAEAAVEGDGPPATGDEDPLTLDEVVVTYTPDDIFERAGSGTVLGEEQLETMGYDDPHSTLRQAPGVYVRTEDGFGLRPNIGMRGVNPERSKKITLMEDGVLFGPAPYSAPAAYYFPLMARMTGIEVLKGPSALLYGPQTVAGAIDLHTREIPTGSEGGADVAFGRFRTRRLHLHYGASNEWGGFLFEGLDVASAGFKTIDGSNRETGFQRTDFMLRGFLQTDPSERVYHRVSLKLGLGRERSNETYLGLSDADFEADPYRRYAASANDRMSWWRTQAVLTHRLEVGESFQLTTDAYRHDFDRSWNRANRFVGRPAVGGGVEGGDLRGILLTPESSASEEWYDLLAGNTNADPADPAQAFQIIDNSRRYVSQGIQTRARMTFGDDVYHHVLQVGLRVHHDGVERDQVEEGFNLTAGALVPDGRPLTTVTNDLRETIATSGYVAYGLEWKGLTLTPGVRAEIIHSSYEDALDSGSLVEGDVTRAAILPGMGAEYAFFEHAAVFAGAHRGFSPASPGQSSDIDPETSVSYELGGRYEDGSEGRHLELVGFLNDYSNIVGECSFSTSCSADMIGRQFNGGDAFVWGAEVTAAWRFDLGAVELPAKVVYTYTDSRFRTTFNSDDPVFGGLDGLVVEGDRLPYVPRHTAQAQLGLKHRLFGVHLVGTYVGESLEEAGRDSIQSNLKTERYFLLDAAIEAHPEEHIRVYARFDNLLNQAPIVSRRPFGARTIKPLGVMVGVEAEF